MVDGFETLREKIRARLAERGQDATSLATALGRDKGYVRDFLNGRKASMRAIEIAKIAGILEMRPSELAGLVNPYMGQDEDHALPLAAAPDWGGRRGGLEDSPRGFAPLRRRVPVYGVPTGEPDGRLLMTGEIVDEVACPPGLENVAGVYAVHVDGDVMEPRYYTGETAWIHPARPLRKGDYVLVQIRGHGSVADAFIRRFGGWERNRLKLDQLTPPATTDHPRDKIISVHLIVMAGSL